MGRPGRFGRELKLDSNGAFIGLNLGYNFFCEHEAGVEGIVRSIRFGSHLTKRAVKNTMHMANFCGASKEQKKQIKAECKKKLELAEKAEVCYKKWSDTKLAPYMLLADTGYFVRQIRVNNNNLQLAGLMLHNGDYSYIGLGGNGSISHISKKFENKIVFSEDELLYTPDYTHGASTSNFGYTRAMASGKDLSSDNPPACGAWQSGSDFITILIDRSAEGCKDLHKQIIDLLKSGNMCCLSQCEMVFKDRGCILMDAQKLNYYGG